jgi:hypothetical protein
MSLRNCGSWQSQKRKNNGTCYFDKLNNLSLNLKQLFLALVAEPALSADRHDEATEEPNSF